MGKKTVLQNLISLATACQLTHHSRYKNVSYTIVGKDTKFGYLGKVNVLLLFKNNACVQIINS